MNKNKKLVSLVCALAMLFTMFSSMFVVKAAGEGFTISTPVENADGTISFDVGYEGITGGVTSGKFAITIPDSVKVTTYALAKDATVSNLEPGDVEGNPQLVSGSFTMSKADLASGKIATVTITVKDALSDDVEISTDAGSNLYKTADSKKYTIGNADRPLGAATATLPRSKNAPTPKPVTTAKPLPVMTDKPVSTDKPVIGPVVSPESGYTLSTPVVDGITMTFDIGYKGITGGVTSGKFAITMPDSIKVETYALAKDASVSNLEPGDVEGNPQLVSGSYTMSNATAESGKIATVTVTLKEAPKYDTQVSLDEGANLYKTADSKKYSVGNADRPLEATNMIIPGSEVTDEKTVTGTIDLNKAITTKVTDNVDPVTKESEYFIIPTIMNGSKPAVYGDDYVAKIGDTPLTEAQYSNLINGHLGAPNVADIVAANNIAGIQDVINKVKYDLYGAGVTVAGKLVKTATGEIMNNDDKTITQGPPTPAPEKVLNVKAKIAGSTTETTNPAKVTISLGQLVTFTADAVNAEAVGTYKYEVTAGADKIANQSAAGAVATYTGEKVGNATVKVSYVDASDKELVPSKTITVAVVEAGTQPGVTTVVKKKDENTNGSIAHGSVQTTPGSNKIAFTDIDTVPWAEDAILALVDKGVINGRSETIFDPNGDVTRAEFAKMVVLAFGLQGGTPGNFTDIDPNAWYNTVVQTAYYNQVITGYDDGTFRPSNNISRQEMAAMISRAIGAANKTLPAITGAIAFDDAWQIGSWAKPAVDQLTQGGVINGMTATTYAPLANATRAQAAVIINRAITNAK